MLVLEVTATILAVLCCAPVRDNRLALKCFGSTTPPEASMALEDEAVMEAMEAFISVLLNFFTDVIFRSSDEEEVTSAVRLKSTPGAGAVLGRCLQRCRPQVQIWQMHFSSVFFESMAAAAEDGFFGLSGLHVGGRLGLHIDG
jgi:hypothetical protein